MTSRYAVRRCGASLGAEVCVLVEFEQVQIDLAERYC